VPERASTGPLGFVLETVVDRHASRAFLLVQLGYFSSEDPELERVVLDLDPLTEVERIPFEFPRDGRATDLAAVLRRELAGPHPPAKVLRSIELFGEHAIRRFAR